MNQYVRGFVSCLVLSLGLIAQAEPSWTPSGWGGGGFYYCAAFSPNHDGVIYAGGDVNGVFKSEDHGKTWRGINKGIAGYGVFALAVDPSAPGTLYAATDVALCKSTDAGEHWIALPTTGKSELRMTGEKTRSIRNVAVDPTNSNIVYVGNQAGKIYKSLDGGQTWNLIYKPETSAESMPSMRVQFGKSNSAVFGGIWMPLKVPATVASPDVVGLGLSIKTEGAQPRDAFLTLKTSTGLVYRSRNLHDQFASADWHDIILLPADFELDPEFKSKNLDKAKDAPATPDWSTINRFDFSAVGGFESETTIAKLGRIYLAVTKTSDGQTGKPDQLIKVSLQDFSPAVKAATYGNARVGDRADGSIFVVAVSPKDPSMIAAASEDKGVLLSGDAGQTWHVVGNMKSASSVAFSGSDPNVIYAACGLEHVWKSLDKGVTWASVSAGLPANVVAKDIVVSSVNSNDVYFIGNDHWAGQFYASSDGGQSWVKGTSMAADPAANPTLPQESKDGANVALSSTTNIVLNPMNPKELFISANWRNAISRDAGKTWTESTKGNDITCVTDIRFLDHRVYVSSMDEGVFTSANNGETWSQLWPLRFSDALSGHYWRLDVREVNGSTRILSTSSPWNVKFNNQLVVSADGGSTFKAAGEGLPKCVPTANTMWGRGYPRALAVDPGDPKIVYLGIDGDPVGNAGGGIFKSTDGGQTWEPLPHQPPNRRMFFALAVDPTNPKRLYWGTCGDQGGLYRSEDGGASWQLVFSQERWIFNLVLAPDGSLLCPGKNLWRSQDNGTTWKQISRFPIDGAIVGLDVNPANPDTIWASVTTWNSTTDGGVYQTTDGGANWNEITGDLPFRKPLVLRFNPATNELWAGGVGLYRLKR